MSDEKMRLTGAGQLQIKGGDNSYIKCGPNTSSFYLNVGSTSNASTTMYDSLSCGIWSSFAGSLHLESTTTSNKVYINFITLQDY